MIMKFSPGRTYIYIHYSLLKYKQIFGYKCYNYMTKITKGSAWQGFSTWKPNLIYILCFEMNDFTYNLNRSLNMYDRLYYQQSLHDL